MSVCWEDVYLMEKFRCFDSLRLLVMFACTMQPVAGNFVTQPTNVTIEEGGSVIIPCRLYGSNDRKWLINDQLIVETNLPLGLSAIQNGLYIAGEYTVSYSKATLQCYFGVYVGPPQFFVFHYSTIGILTIISRPGS